MAHWTNFPKGQLRRLCPKLPPLSCELLWYLLRLWIHFWVEIKIKICSQKHRNTKTFVTPGRPGISSLRGRGHLHVHFPEDDQSILIEVEPTLLKRDLHMVLRQTSPTHAKFKILLILILQRALPLKICIVFKDQGQQRPWPPCNRPIH